MKRASIYVGSIVLLGGVALVAVNVIRSQVERVMSEVAVPANETQSQTVNRLVKDFKQSNSIFSLPTAIELIDEFCTTPKSPELRKIAESTVPQLIPVLSSNDSHMRLSTIQILGCMHESAQSAIPQIIPLLNDPDAIIRSATVDALSEMGEAAKSAIPQIIPLLGDGNTPVRTSAVKFLGHMGPSAKSAAPHIIPLLHDSDDSVRRYAISAIGGIGTSAELLMPFLQDSDKTLRTDAALALSDQNALSNLTVPQLVAILKESALQYRAQDEVESGQRLKKSSSLWQHLQSRIQNELTKRGHKPSAAIDHRP
jgi:HEAT repeat protein